MSGLNEFGYTDEELAVQRQIEEDHALALQLQQEGGGGVPQAEPVIPPEPRVRNVPLRDDEILLGGPARETRVPRYAPAVPIEEREPAKPTKSKKEKKGRKSKKKGSQAGPEETDDSGWTIAVVPGASTEFEGWGFKDAPPSEI